MKNKFAALAVVILLVSTLVPRSANGAPAKPRIAKEKQAVLDWLARPETVWMSGNVLGVDGTEDLMG